jgi:putative transposase
VKQFRPGEGERRVGVVTVGSVHACSETLSSSLKVLACTGNIFKTRRHAKDETIAWLRWYDKARLHSTPAYVISPMQFN